MFELYIMCLLFVGLAGLCVITVLALTAPQYIEDREDY